MVTDPWDATFNVSPAGSESKRLGDNRIRETRLGVQERVDVDHDFSALGSAPSGSETGYHIKATLKARTNPTAVADTIILFAKDVGGKAELHSIDEDSNVIQMTSAGVLLEVNDNVPTTHVTGLLISRDNGGDIDHDVHVTAGNTWDFANTSLLTLPSEITKKIDVTWDVGDDAGGLASGASLLASTLYSIWLIRRSDTGVVDILIDDAWVTPDYPTNYDESVLIGGFCTDSASNLIDVRNVGNYFLYFSEIILDVNDTIEDDTYEPGTLSVPPWAIADVIIHLTNPTTTATQQGVFLKTKGATNPFGNHEATMLVETAGVQDRLTVQAQVMVDANSQIEYAASESDGDATVTITTLGYTMTSRGGL